MLQVVYLGTGAAVPTPGRDNTSLAFDDGEEITLVDASGSPLKRLGDAGLDPDRLARLIVTHQHLDHTYGFPSLLQSLWLRGWRRPLPVYADAPTWEFLARLIDVYRPSSWTDAFPIEARIVDPARGPFLETTTTSWRATPGDHSVPSLAVRVDTVEGRSAVYSSDTRPSAAVAALAQGATLLIHEATYLAGEEAAAGRPGHSTAREAAEVASAAGVHRLALVHHTPQHRGDLQRLHDGAARQFPGPVLVPGDLERDRLA